MLMFEISFEVRDNELDAQGVVNNSNYFIYMAHARHKFLDSIGINFQDYANKKLFLLLTKTEMEFKMPLKANDIFHVTCSLFTEGRVKFAFRQEIKDAEDKLICKAINFGVCIDESGGKRRFVIPKEIQEYCATTNSS